MGDVTKSGVGEERGINFREKARKNSFCKDKGTRKKFGPILRKARLVPKRNKGRA